MKIEYHGCIEQEDIINKKRKEPLVESELDL